MISYAQNFEDVYIHRAFKELDAGFYIDVGAYDPVADSVTQFFYDRGWMGVNVEPGPTFERFQKQRPRDINLKVAVSDVPGQIQFFYHEGDPGTSTLKPRVHPNLKGKVGRRITENVEAVTLDKIFEDVGVDRTVHFLKLDIEGMEAKVVGSVDWRRHRPELILTEATQPYTNQRIDKAWSPILKKAGYELVFFDGINTYYLREESKARRHAFGAPVNVLDGFTKHDPSRNAPSAHANGAAKPASGGDHSGKLATVHRDLQAAVEREKVQFDLAGETRRVLEHVNQELSAQGRKYTTDVGDLQARLETTHAELESAVKREQANYHAVIQLAAMREEREGLIEASIRPLREELAALRVALAAAEERANIAEVRASQIESGLREENERMLQAAGSALRREMQELMSDLALARIENSALQSKLRTFDSVDEKLSALQSERDARSDENRTLEERLAFMRQEQSILMETALERPLREIAVLEGALASATKEAERSRTGEHKLAELKAEIHRNATLAHTNAVAHAEVSAELARVHAENHRHATLLQGLTQEHARVSAQLRDAEKFRLIEPTLLAEINRARRETQTVSDQLRQADETHAQLRAEKHALYHDLHMTQGPRALKAVLPLARVIRRFAGTRKST